MDAHGFIWYLAAGLLTGWLASLMVRGRGMGLVRDLAVGIAGAVIGGMLAEALGIPMENFIHTFGMSLLGGVLFLFILRALTSRKPKTARTRS